MGRRREGRLGGASIFVPLMPVLTRFMNRELVLKAKL